MGLAFRDNATLVVANYLRDSLQVVDLAQMGIAAEISLPPLAVADEDNSVQESAAGEFTPLALRGEAIFYDADRSLNNWFSCHSCHCDGHTSGLLFDTLNDGNFNSPKLTPSLRAVVQTPPWTWHGWQTDLAAAVEKSLTTTMHSELPVTADDTRAVVAFLETLHPLPRDAAKASSPAALRGEQLFNGKAGCIQCHAGKHFTSTQVVDVGLGTPQDAYTGFNPPSLAGLATRRRWLHDGRARSLVDVLTLHHRPQDLGGVALSEHELEDLLAWLGSL